MVQDLVKSYFEAWVEVQVGITVFYSIQSSVVCMYKEIYILKLAHKGKFKKIKTILSVNRDKPVTLDFGIN